VKPWLRHILALATAGAVLLAVLAPTTASAGRSTSNFTVQGTVGSGCTLTTQIFAFPAYQTGQGSIDKGQTNFTVTCAGASPSHRVPVTFTFAPSGGNFAMAWTVFPILTLPYSLCFDSACATVYQNNVAGPSVSIQSEPQIYTLYGEIAANQFAINGQYSQTVTATLTY
jgi:spore coat protein U-like protein